MHWLNSSVSSKQTFILSWRQEEYTVLISARCSTSRFIIRTIKYQLLAAISFQGGTHSCYQYYSAVMSKNRNQLLFYRSQANTPRSQVQPNPKLYGSGANIASQSRSPNKNMQEVQLPHRDCQPNQPSEIYQKSSRHLQRANRARQPLLRSRSGDHVSWHSPSKLGSGDNFKSIIEEINEQNDRNFSQLDTDLKRIKSNLTRIEQQGSEAKMSSHNQALLEEIQILQQQNDRLREKNIALIADKKKMGKEIEEYQSVLQREKVKQIVGRSHIQVKEDIVTTRKLKVELEEKISECEKVKLIHSQLLSSKATWEKREGLLGEEKNKLTLRIGELQREKDRLQIALEQDLKKQMEKKDSHYCKLMKSQESKYEQVISKLKENLLRSNQMEREYIATQTKQQLERLHLQKSKIGEAISTMKNEKARIQNQKEQLERKVDAMSNQLELLGYSYRELSESSAEKDSSITQLKKKLSTLNEDLKRKHQDMEGMRLKGEEETKRVHYLQQLCNKIQRQLQLKQGENERDANQLSKALMISEKQAQKYQLAFESARKEKLMLEEEIKQAFKEKDKFVIQLKRKAEEIMQLKKQNIILTQQTKSLRLNLSPEKPEKDIVVGQRIEQRLQRLHSARDLRQGQAKYTRDLQQARLKKMEKQLTDLMHQCKIQSEKTRGYFKERQLKLQESNKTLQKRVDELNSKLEQAERQLRSKMQELSRQEDSARQMSRKKETQFLQQERKVGELSLKNKSMQQQLQSLKKRLSDVMAKRYEQRIKESQQKIVSLREQFKKIIATIVNELNSIYQCSSSQSIKIKGLQISCKQFKNLQDIQKIAQLTYSIYNIGNYIQSLHKKIKEASVSKQAQPQSQSSLLDRSESILDDHSKKAKKREKGYKITEKINDCEDMGNSSSLQRKYQRQLIQSQERIQQIQNLSDETRRQRRQISRLKQQLEQSQQEKQELMIKFKLLQEKQTKQQQRSQMVLPEREYPSFEYVTPVKQYGSMRHTALEEDFERKMRSRIRSVRSCQKRDQSTQHQQKQMERKLLSCQSNLSKLRGDLDEKSEKLQRMEKMRDEVLQRERRLKAKYEETLGSLELMDNQLEKQQREKTRLEARNKELQYQMSLVNEQKSKLESRMQQSFNQIVFDRQKREKELREALLEKQLIQKRLKRDLEEKEERLIGIVQQYELKLIEINSQVNRCNENINELTIKLASSSSLNEQYSARLSNKEEKLKQQQQLVHESKQRLQKEQRERESLVAMFSSNTTRLSKIIQEKQIEIEQLKFIQETTLINLQFARSQQRRTPSESTYSFKNDF